MLTEGGKVYAYNSLNQLISLTENGQTTTYDYWIDGLRRSKTLANGDEEEYLWDGNNLVYINPSLSEYLLTGFTAYYGLGIFESNQNGTKYRYQRNAHGDTTALLNQSGDIVRCYIYEDAFGTSTYSTDDTNPFRYAGQYYDRESQSYYLRARYYLPRYGRFTAEDPARDGLNWYTYCANNPVKYVDFTGYWQESDADLPEELQEKIRLYTMLYEISFTDGMRQFFHRKAESVRNNYALSQSITLSVNPLCQNPKYGYGCVITSLTMMINYQGYNYSVDDIYAANENSQSATYYKILGNLKLDGSFSIGLSGENTSEADILAKCRSELQANRPTMVEIQYSGGTHSVVVYGMVNGGQTASDFLVIDPYDGSTVNRYTKEQYTLESRRQYFEQKNSEATIDRWRTVTPK